MLLPELARVLNEIHRVSYTVQYWRLVVGWWLFYFAQVFFDRWQVMQGASVAHPNARMLRLPPEGAVPASYDMNAFVAAIVGDAWNERLSADIADRWTSIQVIETSRSGVGVDIPEGNAVVQQSGNRPARRWPFSWVARALAGLSRRQLFYGDGVALDSDNLRRFEKIKLTVLMRQLPTLRNPQHLAKASAEGAWRAWLLPTHDGDSFANALAAFVPQYLPTCFLEGYARESKLAEEFGSILNPRVIMTASAFSPDDRWKMWAGLQGEMGAKIVIAQHGGHYGSGAWSASQMHEIAISHRYLSWGWTDVCEPKVYPAPSTKLIGLGKRRPRRAGSCLLVTASLPRQSYWLYSAPVGPQLSSYLEDQFSFAASLSDDVKEDLVVRLNSVDFGWDIEDRWRDVEPGVAIDSGRGDLQELIKETRLYVATYNATTFLESFIQNVPTVIHWNPTFWEVSSEAKPYFDALRRASILFDDPLACAAHVNSIWDDVPTWWKSAQVRSSVAEFSRRFAYVGPRPLRELRSALTQW